MIVTGRAGFIMVAAAVVMLVIPWQILFFWCLVVAVLVILVVDVLRAGSPRELSVTRSGENAVRLGEEIELSVHIINKGKRPLRAFIKDAWQPSAGADSIVHKCRIAAGETFVISTRLKPVRRGDKQAAAFTVRSLGPLGFSGRQRTLSIPGKLRVLPPFISRKYLPSRMVRLRQLEGSTIALQRGKGSEFDSLREYVPGDDVRSIDWRASARSRDIVVRTWNPERDQPLLLVLDCSRTSAGRIGVDPLSASPTGWPRLDWSMDAALLLAALASKAGDRVSFLAYERQKVSWIQSRGEGSFLASMVDSMTPLESELVEIDARGLVETIEFNTRRKSHLVIFTDLARTTFEESWLPVLPQLTQHHRVSIASVADPKIDELVELQDTVEQVYSAAAAEWMHAERGAVAQELQLMGITVVDEVPLKFAPAVADMYIKSKTSLLR